MRNTFAIELIDKSKFMLEYSRNINQLNTVSEYLICCRKFIDFSDSHKNVFKTIKIYITERDKNLKWSPLEFASKLSLGVLHNRFLLLSGLRVCIGLGPTGE